MIDRERLRARVEAAFRVLRILCAAMALSTGFYVLVAIVVVGVTDGGLGGDLPPALTTSLALLGLASVLAAVAVERLVLRAGETRRMDVEALIGVATRATIMGFAFREVAAVMGLVVTLLTGNLVWVVAGSAAALLAMLVAWPRQAAVEDWILRNHRSR